MLVGAFCLCCLSSISEGKRINGFEIVDPLVPAKQILSGGPGRDGILALNYPKFEKGDLATYLSDSDRVLGIESEGQSKAYPIGILNWHELVNDLIAGRPVVVSYCPLCGSGVTFESPIQGGVPHRFGVSGLLYNSDVLLYDRETESLWSQIMGKAINGSLKGTELKSVPTIATTWGDWKRRHPDTLVISVSPSDWKRYRKSPYGDYSEASSLMFGVGQRDRSYHNKALVLGIELAGAVKAYPFVELEHEESPLQDEIGGQSVFVHYDKGINSAVLTDQSGNVLPAVTLYWFAWYAFHPETEVFQSGKVSSKQRKRVTLDYEERDEL